MENQKQELKPGGVCEPGNPQRSLGDLIISAISDIGQAAKEDAEDREREETRKAYGRLTLSFLGATLMEISDIDSDLRESIADAKGKAKMIEFLKTENEDLVRRLRNIQDYSCAANEALARAEAKLAAFNTSDTKKLLEANNALLLENEQLKKSIAGYKSQATIRKNQAKKARKTRRK